MYLTINLYISNLMCTEGLIKWLRRMRGNCLYT